MNEIPRRPTNRGDRMDAAGVWPAELRRRVAGKVPLDRCRELLGEPASDWTDAEVLALRERLADLADLAIEMAEEEIAA